ncbi:DUF748 domain-containing protein [Flavobacterium sp.]|uniref:DUF748 domain-containing protein n=1 Tax=Flavobacterium sp. TaxID=239 RepID=UPI003C4812BD
MALKYSDIDVNVLLGTITLHNVLLKIKDKEAQQFHSYLNTESLQVVGIGYWDLLMNETLAIQKVVLTNPTFNNYPYKHIVSKKTQKNSQEKGLKLLSIEELAIINGRLNVMKKGQDSIKIALPSCDFSFFGSNMELQSEDRAITYDHYVLKATKVILNNNDYSIIKIDDLSTNEGKLMITDFQIIPKYSKTELSKHLKKERDYINLKIPQINIEKPVFDWNKKRFGISVKWAQIVKPNLEIYRDKLIADDLTVKPLYSESLRNLTFDLYINRIEIKKGYISYAELVDPKAKAGKLFFDEVDASIYQLSTFKSTKKTEIKVKSKLMGQAPLTLNWSFDINNKSDEFLVNGSVNSLDAKVLNPFFKPNLNALAEGTLKQMYFNFQGNNHDSKGIIKMKYEDFNFKILRKDSNKINKFLTAIGSLFIKEDSKENPEDFRLGEIQTEREPTKSFFNYLWINVKSGIISTLTGDGKK